MNLMLNDDDDHRNHPQRPRTILKVALGVLCGAALGLAPFVPGTDFFNSSKTSALVSSLITFMVLVFIFIASRRLPYTPLRATKTFSRTRRRIGVLSYFVGWLGFFLMPTLHSLLRLGSLGAPLTCLGIVSIALSWFGLTVLRGSAQSRLGALWIHPGQRLDERELQLRQKALALTCKTLVVSTWLAGFLLLTVDQLDVLQTMNGRTLLLSLVTLAYLGLAGMGLPSAILAWTEPEPSSADS
jgi:hypothetical protein